MSEIHFEYHEMPWWGTACVLCGMTVALVGAGTFLWMLFRRR